MDGAGVVDGVDRRDGVTVSWRRIADGMPRREAAWALLRELLPAAVRLSNPCARCGGPHGAVRIEGADFVASVSYAGEYAVVAVGDRAAVSAIGVDAEPADDPRRDAAGMEGVLGRGEASVRSWTRVEAALKADGRGLRVDPATVRIDETPDGWTAAVPGGGLFFGADVAAPPALVVSVAVRPRVSSAPPPLGETPHTADRPGVSGAVRDVSRLTGGVGGASGRATA